MKTIFTRHAQLVFIVFSFCLVCGGCATPDVRVTYCFRFRDALTNEPIAGVQGEYTGLGSYHHNRFDPGEEKQDLAPSDANGIVVLPQVVEDNFDHYVSFHKDGFQDVMLRSVMGDYWLLFYSGSWGKRRISVQAGRVTEIELMPRTPSSSTTQTSSTTRSEGK